MKLKITFEVEEMLARVALASEAEGLADADPIEWLARVTPDELVEFVHQYLDSAVENKVLNDHEAPYWGDEIEDAAEEAAERLLPQLPEAVDL